ncbi:S-layer homology domain-containing protein [Tumebacillus permanentifrigoris]|uniref:S-layer family protein n=1 Tax=Tumebacillus permanentifrigoris TaxID=378543 RepID=A0A316DF97_9BACL|nr:S-layer homology domain-containing protein [Tumebacillus permanentifrigoris]PWK16232.1 S-layer family protein [Tumebacillus permanentifrigoris]
MTKSKKFTAAVAASAVASAMVAPAAFAGTTFSDIDGSFAKDAIVKLADAGIINGVGNGQFNPTGLIERQDFAIILAKALKLDTTSAPASATFSDIPKDHYAFAAVEAAVKAGLIKGNGDGSFGAGANLSRQDMAVFFGRALNVVAGSDVVAGKASKLSFSDNASIADYAKDAVGAAFELGYISGDNGAFNPNGNATREQVASLATRWMAAAATVGNASVTGATVVDNNTLTLSFSKEVAEVKAADVKVAVKATNAVVNVQSVTLAADKKSATVKVDNLASGTTFSVSFGGKTVDVTTATPSSLAVSSVSVLNGKQIAVKFSKEVEAVTATTAANYTLVDSAGGAVPFAAPVLQDDGVTVILNLTNATLKTMSTPVAVTVKGVLDAADATVKAPLYSTTVTISDTTAATVVSVSSKTNSVAADKLTVTFSEPVNTPIFKIDGVVKAGVANADFTAYTISNLSLDAAASHTLQVLNLSDFSTNNTPLVTQTFNVTKDVAAPTASVAAKNDHQFLVTFSKAVDATTVAGTMNIVVKDELLGAVNSTVTADSSDTTGTKFIVSITDAGLYTNKDSRTFTLLLNNNIADTLGNKLTAMTTQVALNKDVTAPTITGATFKTNATTGGVLAIVLSLSEGAAANPALSTAGIKVIDQNGVDKTAGFFAPTSPVTAGSTKVTLNLAAEKTDLYNNYSFFIPAGLIADNSQALNKTAAYTANVNFGTTPTSTFTVAQSGYTPVSTNKFVFDFKRAVKGGAVAGSATDLNNYTINGSALPAGTSITLDIAMNVATITLPANSIAKTDSNAIFTISNVQDSSGNVVSPFSGFVAVADNVSPVMSAAALNADGTVSLTFSEALNANNASDFVVSVNGSNLSAGYTVQKIVAGADAGKFLVTVQVAHSTGVDATAGTADDFAFIDANGDATFNAGDIKVAVGATTGALMNADLTSALISSVKVSTVAAPAATDASGNALTGGTTVTAK